MWTIRIFVSAGEWQAVQVASIRAATRAELPSDASVVDTYSSLSPSFITLENGQQEGRISRFIYTAKPSLDNLALGLQI